MEITPNSVKSLIHLYKKELSSLYPAYEIMQMVYYLFEAYMGLAKTTVHLSLNQEIPDVVMPSFTLALAELATGKPVQYVLGWTLFNGSRITVNSNVLIPRPETEELCSIIKSDCDQKPFTPSSILDIGTGTGCISIDLKKHFPNARVTGVDSSPEAIDTAILNARDNYCKIDFHVSDILNDINWVHFGLYNIIVSNPPYVLETEKKKMNKNVIDFEPANALFVPDDNPLLYYRSIAAFAKRHLATGGLLYFEINEQFGLETGNLVQNYGYDKVEVVMDIRGKARFVRAILSSP
jgi:release factor glutamine methyltransferase